MLHHLTRVVALAGFAAAAVQLPYLPWRTWSATWAKPTWAKPGADDRPHANRIRLLCLRLSLYNTCWPLFTKLFLT